MPQQQTFQITAPDGKTTLEITGDRVPTAAELQEIFKASGITVPSAPSTQLETPLSHPHAKVGQAVIDAAKGIKAGALSTVYHGGDVIRRSLGMERVIDTPEAQAVITPPDNLAGKAGFLVEQGAEFAVPLTRLAKLTKSMGLGKRMAVDAAASLGVGAVQSGGDPATMGTAATLGAAVPMVGGVVRAASGMTRRAASGAAEGGVGGAVAAAVRRAAPLDAQHMLFQGLKPRNSRPDFLKTIANVLPDIKASEAEMGKAIGTLDDFMEATTAAKKRIRADYDAIAGPMREKGSLVDLTPVGEAMEQSIPYKVKLESPELADKILKQAKVYRESLPLEKAEQLLKETNAELEAFYNKFPMGQRRALAADPDAARLHAQAKALRDAIYKTLDADGQTGAARALNKKYGALMEIEDTATRRANVARRQQPESLSEQFSTARAAGEFARGGLKLVRGDLTGAFDIAAGRAMRDASRFMKEQQTTDALIRRAFASLKSGGD